MFAVADSNKRIELAINLTFGKYYEPSQLEVKPNLTDYKLPINTEDIINYDQISSSLNLIKTQEDLIEKNGFAVIEFKIPSVRLLNQPNEEEPVSYYQYLNSKNIPYFITTDTILHLYHIQFDETLKDIEENYFIKDLHDITSALLANTMQGYETLDGDLKEASWRNIAYLSVAYKFIDPNFSIPALVNDIVLKEISKVDTHNGFKSSDIFKYQEDYSQYIPRGHYTKSENLKRYFKTMMWYGRMSFLLNGGPDKLVSEYDAKIQTLQAMLLTSSLKNISIGEKTGLELWDKIYTVISFYVGFTDDLTTYDYLQAIEKVYGSEDNFTKFADESKLLKLKNILAQHPSPKIYIGTGNIILSQSSRVDAANSMLDSTKGMRLMGQRFIPDSYIFQNLIYPQVGNYEGDFNKKPFTLGQDGSRSYVRGLDLMALLGSHEASNILTNDGDVNYRNYNMSFNNLKSQFNDLSQVDWNRNLYWSWLYCLQSLVQDLPDDYPAFMRTQAWQRYQLNSALASWTQLRHDTILFTKHQYLSGGMGVRYRPEPPPGYFEPLPIFWGRLLSLTRMTSKGLDEFNVLPAESKSRLESLEKMIQRIIDIVAKQLTNENLSSDDKQFIKELPSSLDKIIAGTGTEDLKTTLVVDIHSNSMESKIVEEAIGKMDLIVVACPMTDGNVFLAAGPVMSYYEFKHPMSDRLTDETWRKLIDSSQMPEKPNWYISLMGK
jgi:hypothetical protein